MTGAYDMHVHVAPSHFKRSIDAFDLVSAMDEYRMAGAVLKMHFADTVGQATLVNSHSGARSKVFGSVVLNHPSGGINPYAVESALSLGGKVVWMPTFHAKADQIATNFQHNSMPAKGMRILDENSKLLPAVYDVFDVVKKYGAVLATGHMCQEETTELIWRGLEQGVRMVVTHPDSKAENIPLELQKRFAEAGAVISKCWFNVIKGDLNTLETARRIRHIGAEHCILVTDFGQARNPIPPIGMADFIDALLRAGLQEDEIKVMICQNPAALLSVADK